MVTWNILHLTIVAFLDVVVKKNFLLLPVDWYLFRVVTGNRYLTRGSNENALFITSTSNVSVSRWVITLVAIPLLDFVMIHWIRWIQWNSLRKNSNASYVMVTWDPRPPVDRMTWRKHYITLYLPTTSLAVVKTNFYIYI